MRVTSAKDTVVVYGPPGTEKTDSAERLRQMFRCDVVVEDWKPSDPLVPKALHLTREDVSALPAREASVVSIQTALGLLGGVA